MGRRARRRDRGGQGPSSFADLGIDLDLDLQAAADETARASAGEVELELRVGMSPGTRAEYAALRRGDRSSAAATREDDWARAIEFLFERLAVTMWVAGVATTGQKALLQRLRVATPDERRAVRDALRAHLASRLPDVPAP